MMRRWNTKAKMKLSFRRRKTGKIITNNQMMGSMKRGTLGTAREKRK